MGPNPVKKNNDISLATTVAGLRFTKPLGNSPNPLATTTEMLLDIAKQSATGAFTTRTACPGFIHDDAKHQWRAIDEHKNTINCLGYSCHDFDYYCQSIQTIHAIEPQTVAILSLTGSAVEVAELLALTAQKFGGNSNLLVEINLSCPNIPNKPPVAYDAPALQEYLEKALENGVHGLRVGVKLAPYVHDSQFVQVAAVLNKITELAFVTTINTVGCGLAVDIESESPVLAEASGASFGGLGGPAVHSLALGNVRRFRQLLRDDLDIIGVGGINSGAAIFRMLLCGAKAVMLASNLLTEGVGCFGRMEQELLEIMHHKGYTSLENFMGKLRDASNGNV